MCKPCIYLLLFQVNSDSPKQKDILALAFDTAFESAPSSPESVTPVDDSAYSSSTSQDFFTSTSPEIKSRTQEDNDSTFFSTSPTHIDALQYELSWNVMFNPVINFAASPAGLELNISSVPEQSSSEQSSESTDLSTSQGSEDASGLSPILSSSPVESSLHPAASEPVSTVQELPIPIPDQQTSSSSPSSFTNVTSAVDCNELTNLFLVPGHVGNNNSDVIMMEDTIKRHTNTPCVSSVTKPVQSPEPIPELKFSAISTLGNFFNSIPDISVEEDCDEPPSKRPRQSANPYMSETDWLELLVKCSGSAVCRCNDSPLQPTFSTEVQHQQQLVKSDPNRYVENATFSFDQKPQVMSMNTVPLRNWQQQITSTFPETSKQIQFSNPRSPAPRSPRSRAEQRRGKPGNSYISLIGNAILSSSNYQRSLPEIYDHIMEQHSFYRTTTLAWRNAVRHNLSHNECFIKAERIDTGRGWTWTIHPSCLEQFKRGDFRRREARNRVQQLQRNSSHSALLQ